MPILAAIIGAVTVIGTTVMGINANSEDVDEVNRIGQINANRARQDQLKRDEWNENIDRWSMRQKGKEFRQGVKEFKQGVKERGVDRKQAAEQTGMQNVLGLVNQNASLRQIMLNTSKRGRAA